MPPRVINLNKDKPKFEPPAQGSFAPPKAASMPLPANMSNQMPFAPGAIIRGFQPTPGEQAKLEEYGWKPGDPVPENLPELIAAAEASAKKNLPLPIPIDTPPLRLPTEQPIDALTPDHQRNIFAALQAAKDADEDAKRIARAGVKEAGPGINEAIAAANVVDDRAQQTYAGTEQPKRESPTGAVFEKTHCQHCGWELRMSSPPEPSEEDKFVFVQSVLGGVPFTKTVKAFNDQLFVTTRSLSVPEVDLCHKQVYYEKELGEVITPFDVTEAVVRYRMCLQLVQLKGAGMDFDLPDSIESWIESLKMSGIEIPKGHTPLRVIKEWVDKHIFKTETMIRLISTIVADLNRLLVRLEANYLNSDFWKGTVA